MNKKDKYSALSADLAQAYKTAISIYKNHDDGGTCNFDAPALNLPRWIEEKTKQAAKAAGPAPGFPSVMRCRTPDTPTNQPKKPRRRSNVIFQEKESSPY